MNGSTQHLLRTYRPGDEEAFLPLLRSCLGETAAAPQSRRFWEWKHLENPFGQSYGLYAWDERARQALALRVFMRWRFTDKEGNCVAAVRAVDTATAPGSRRTGLFTALTTRAVGDVAGDGTAFIFNTPNASSLPGYLKMGWEVVAAWPLVARVQRPLRCLAALARGRRAAEQAPPEWPDFFREDALRWADVRERCGDGVERLVEAWERQRPRRGLRTVRTAAYLDWRYGGHPAVVYAAIPLWRGGTLAALAVLRPNSRFGLREAVLAEIFLQEADPGLARDLLAAVARMVRADYVVGHFAEDSFELASLRRARYLRVPGRTMTFTVRRLREQGPDPRRADVWDLSAGDLEIF